MSSAYIYCMAQYSMACTSHMGRFKAMEVGFSQEAHQFASQIDLVRSAL